METPETPVTPENPAALLGNPLRIFSMTSPPPPLDMDAAIVAGLPDVIPYPFAVEAAPYASNEFWANYQAWLDYQGIVVGFAPWFVQQGKYATPPLICKNLAQNSGDSFIFQGVTYSYVPGAWSPF